ncbi:MAG TPA: fasciclin domain-containing protein [Polyangiaceae bacterium LLY-WYZ-15_(1-7)]|nr:fasciclin domain-containing protein [Polyangiaceae bacterium LLY-WYZ-15_(1-7)]HJL01002.1 fasciclin domain-containing protein [Polyangiaceae bacterium LLY-WYZ-15_(1-7)]HJL12156.1 fasciclin domain-containing protein [Polyangiaceae bacterium LLY-WYZ-15_(1-7)]HJL26240.1 fasciclin domain-containing protein [Polyangiaceae bacterium LLY-WYZ-15_(1-7)]HJL30659.1 fasciclin domain-containing protein [Polyangiaceae bacterium LLY-WYZ-15_(1-7)]
MTRIKYVAMLALAIGLVGCGDDDGTDPGTDSGTPGEDGGTMMMDDAGETGGDTIVDVAVANGSFTTLVGALESTGLDEALAGDGPFTVFAPTDDAFEALGVDLSTLSTEELTTILQYHVVAGEVPSTAIPATADTLADLTLVFDTSDGVVVNDASVVMADVEASNGVIHVIDTVLLPPDIPTMAGYAGLSSLAGALGDAELVEALQAEGPFTVFAPTNDAFGELEAVPTGDALASVLLYHVVSGTIAAEDIPTDGAAFVDTLSENEGGNGITLVATAAGGSATINGAGVAVADVKCTNGVVHVIDAVLLPPNIVDMVGIAGLTELGDAVGAAADIDADTSVADALAGDGPLTVFAPTNAAFEDISETVAGLSAEQVRDVLLYHVVDGAVLSTDLADGDVETLLGQDVTIDTAGPTVDGAASDPSNIVVTDINLTNGVVHVIDTVLIPTL